MKKKTNFKRVIGRSIMIILGALIAAYGLESILIPNQVSDGGVTGISIVLSQLFNVPLGVLIGIINIPSLNLELPVMSDWSYEKMKISPVRYSGSFENNDLVICAHSYKTFFRYIKNLKVGDVLIFTNIDGNVYLYEVEVVEILSPENIKEMIENEFDLTLFTCTSDSQNRVTVRLNRVDGQIAIK